MISEAHEHVYTNKSEIVTIYRRINLWLARYKIRVRNHMRIRVYFCIEPVDARLSILKHNKISKQAIFTIYQLVWESEFKNILNVGRIWLKFRNEESPFGIALRHKRSHQKIDVGDIIQIDSEFYMVDQVGGRRIEVVD
jgi:hypothetical protein